jgi:hypothetical protein
MSNGDPIQPIGYLEVQEAVKRTEARLAEMGIKLEKIDEIDDRLKKIEDELKKNKQIGQGGIM